MTTMVNQSKAIRCERLVDQKNIKQMKRGENRWRQNWKCECAISVTHWVSLWKKDLCNTLCTHSQLQLTELFPIKEFLKTFCTAAAHTVSRCGIFKIGRYREAQLCSDTFIKQWVSGLQPGCTERTQTSSCSTDICSKTTKWLGKNGKHKTGG